MADDDNVRIWDAWNQEITGTIEPWDHWDKVKERKGFPGGLIAFLQTSTDSEGCGFQQPTIVQTHVKRALRMPERSPSNGLVEFSPVLPASSLPSKSVRGRNRGSRGESPGHLTGLEDGNSHNLRLDLPGSCVPGPEQEDGAHTCGQQAANQAPAQSPAPSPSIQSRLVPSQNNERSASKPSTFADSHQEPETGRKQTVVASQGELAGGKATSSANAFAVAKVALSQSSKACAKLGFVDAVEPAMQLYLNDCCSDGPSAWVRGARTAGFVLSLLFFLPLLSFVPLLIPFSAPHEGFASNWTFNFVAHPILNYVPPRASLELLARAIEPQERHRVRWIVRWIPLVSCIVCLLIHGTASLFGIFPLPFSALTSCIPGILSASFLAKYLTPTDLLTHDFRQFAKFVLLMWTLWMVQFLILTGYLLSFPLFAPFHQVLLSFAVTGILSGFGFFIEMLAVWIGVPKYYATELKPMIYFISFLFTAALFSSAKSMWVFVIMLIMLVQDAGKALAILSKTWIFLSNYFVRPVDSEEENAVGKTKSQTQKCYRQCLSFWSMIEAKVSSIRETARRLRHILVEFQWHTRESLQRATITAADARLLGNFVRFFVLFTMVEVCEVLVPLLYIIVATLLQIPEVGQNRQYLYVFKDMNFGDALRGNFVAFLIETSVFLVTQVVVLRTLGFNLWYFAGNVLALDFWYWTFAFSTCCVAWTIVLIAHAGHDLEWFQSLFLF
eukprot:s93_g23.t1